LKSQWMISKSLEGCNLYGAGAGRRGSSEKCNLAGRCIVKRQGVPAYLVEANSKLVSSKPMQTVDRGPTIPESRATVGIKLARPFVFGKRLGSTTAMSYRWTGFGQVEERPGASEAYVMIFTYLG